MLTASFTGLKISLIKQINQLYISQFYPEKGYEVCYESTQRIWICSGFFHNKFNFASVSILQLAVMVGNFLSLCKVKE